MSAPTPRPDAGGAPPTSGGSEGRELGGSEGRELAGSEGRELSGSEGREGSAPPVEASESGKLDLLLALLPAALSWGGVLAAAWAWKPLSQGEIDPVRLGLGLFGPPGVALGLLLGVHLACRSLGMKLGRPSRWVLVWMMLFLLGVEGLVLALSFGLVEQPGRLLAPGVGLLFFGLSPLVERLEPGSPLGIRTRSTLASRERWRRTHRVLALCFFLAGACGVVAIALDGTARVLAVTLPPAMALTVSLIHGAFGAQGPVDDRR